MSETSSTRPDDVSLQRELVTPEGVDLRIALGSAGQRAGAFLMDALMIGGILLALSLVCLFAAMGVGFANPMAPTLQQAIGVIWLVGFFVLRNGWFLGFELGARGATPGKRMFGLRVAARHGGRLSADALVARNAMREIEVFLPLTFLLVNTPGGVDGWIVLFGLLWTGVFALFPLFNRDRLRVGDLVAGTWVVRQPKRRLVADLAQARRPVAARFAFTDAQLDAYGVKELQVLEGVLRQNSRAVVGPVAERIRSKIGWTRRLDESDDAFLEAYYVGLRARLEARLLVGRRRRDKHDAP